MSDDNRPSALKRKAGAGRAPPEIGQPSLARILQLALAQAAETVAGLALVAGPVEERRTTLAAICDSLPDTALLAMLEGPDSRFGLAVLDADTVAALIETQTTGRVVPRPADSRAPTRTDAMMCADTIDRLCELLEARVVAAALPQAATLAGYRFAMALADARAVAMTLADLPYRLLSVPLDLGAGAKSGRIELILPAELQAPARAGAGDARFADALAAHVLTSGVALTATLCRVEMTLADLSALAPGQLIPVPARALGEIAIEDLGGAYVGRGRLGQSNGRRAVRIVLETPPAASAPASDPPDVAN
jgi:flagellar motor switch protein FliM